MRDSCASARLLFGVIVLLLAAQPSSSEPAHLRISAEPALAVAHSRDHRMIFAVTGSKQVQLRVRALDGGELSDVTSSCHFSSLSSHVSVSSDGQLTIGESLQKTIAAVTVECGSSREIVGFVLSPGTSGTR